MNAITRGLTSGTSAARSTISRSTRCPAALRPGVGSTRANAPRASHGPGEERRTRFVFERAESGRASHVDKRAVFVIGVDGSHPRRLTPWAERDGDNPDWSPDGKWIIFRSHNGDPDRQSQIFLIHPDGSGRKQLTHFSSGTHVASSTFSPDGKWIAISKGPEGGNIDVFVMRLDGTHPRRTTHSKLWESAPDWGPR